MTELITILGLLGALVGIVTGILAIRRHYHPEWKAQIISPPSQSTNGGRLLTITARVPTPRRRAAYWIAVQPDGCRANDLWWPQNSPLPVTSPEWISVPGVGLGGDGGDAEQDIGAHFTVGLFEVVGPAQEVFVDFAQKGKPMQIPSMCRLLHAIDVTRVRW